MDSIDKRYLDTKLLSELQGDSRALAIRHLGDKLEYADRNSIFVSNNQELFKKLSRRFMAMEPAEAIAFLEKKGYDALLLNYCRIPVGYSAFQKHKEPEGEEWHTFFIDGPSRDHKIYLLSELIKTAKKYDVGVLRVGAGRNPSINRLVSDVCEIPGLNAFPGKNGYISL